jgi:EAL domain-containing protein (putative c-di-GMP-specific phosphodiesterase class I)
MQIVAECVETEKQLAILKKMDCDIIQGYLFSKPLTAENAERYLAGRKMKKHLNSAG